MEKEITMALENASLEYVAEIIEDIDPADFVLPKEISTNRMKENVAEKLLRKNDKQVESDVRNIESDARNIESDVRNIESDVRNIESDVRNIESNARNIESNVKSIGSNEARSKIVSFGRIAAVSAASVVLLFGVSMAMSEDLRAALVQRFSFIPGKGVVSIEQVPDATGEDMVAQDDLDYYIMTNENRDTHSENLDIRLNSVVCQSGVMEVSYAVILNKVDFAAESQVNDKLNHLDELEREEYRQVFADYYKKLGYETYFNISAEEAYNFNALKAVKSNVMLEQKQLVPVSSEIIESEAGMGDYFEIKEQYDISGIDLSQVQQCSLQVGDVAAAFTLGKAQDYESADEVLEQVVTVDGDAIAESILCNPTWGADSLSLELYYNPIGDGMRVVSCMAHVLADDEEIYGEQPVSIGENAQRMEFDLSEVKDAKHYKIVIENVELEFAGKEMQLDLSDHQYRAHEEYLTVETLVGTVVLDGYQVMTREEVLAQMGEEEETVASDASMAGWMPEGDYIAINFDVTNGRKDALVASFECLGATECSNNIIGYLDEDGAHDFIPLGTTVDQVNILTLTNFRVNYDPEIVIER